MKTDEHTLKTWEKGYMLKLVALQIGIKVISDDFSLVAIVTN